MNRRWWTLFIEQWHRKSNHRHEGLLAGAREILERREADESGTTFDYILGAVGEIFEADVAHAGLVESVLGPYETFLITTERARFLADREALGELTSRVRAFALDAVPASIAGPDLSQQPGFVARLRDWVTVPANCEALANYMLGRTYVVESVEAGMPGALPVMNRQAFEFAVLGGLALECDIAGVTKWDRKSYYYPDMRRYRLRHNPNACKCGYDLTGNQSGRCPECGRSVTIALT